MKIFKINKIYYNQIILIIFVILLITFLFLMMKEKKEKFLGSDGRNYKYGDNNREAIRRFSNGGNFSTELNYWNPTRNYINLKNKIFK